MRGRFDADEDAVTTTYVRDLRAPARVEGRSAARAAATSAPARHAAGLWDANDVAAYLKVSRSWVYHRAEAGLLPHLRVGGLLRFDPEVVRAFARK